MPATFKGDGNPSKRTQVGGDGNWFLKERDILLKLLCKRPMYAFRAEYISARKPEERRMINIRATSKIQNGY